MRGGKVRRLAVALPVCEPETSRRSYQARFSRTHHITKVFWRLFGHKIGFFTVSFKNLMWKFGNKKSTYIIALGDATLRIFRIRPGDAALIHKFRLHPCNLAVRYFPELHRYFLRDLCFLQQVWKPDRWQLAT